MAIDSIARGLAASQLSLATNVKQFGAKGDGVTNDTSAFVAAAAAVQALGGGRLLIPPGTYILGSQTFAGATGKGYSYLPSAIISISGCTKPLSIEGYGATIRIAAGLKFGSFDPTTGAASNTGYALSSVSWASTSGGQISANVAGSPSIVATNVVTLSGCTNTGTGGNAPTNSQFTVFSVTGSPVTSLILSASAPTGFYGTIGGAPTLNITGFANADHQASIGKVIDVQNNTGGVSIRGLEIDGNQANLVLGGQYSDTGWQQPAIGIYSFGNNSLNVEDVYVHHHGEDGVYIGYDGLTETSVEFSHSLTNVRSEYNARQGLSWVGGNNLTLIGCKLNNTGMGTFNSKPGAGIDVEPNGGTVCRNLTIINTQIYNNFGEGITFSGGDIADINVYASRITGTVFTAVELNNNGSRTSFIDCLFVGRVVDPYSSTTNPNYSTNFLRCSFTDDAAFGWVNVGTLPLLYMPAATNVILDHCNIISTQTRLGDIRGAKILDTTFTLSAGTGFISNNNDCGIFWGSLLSNVTFVDNISVNIPAGNYYVNVATGGTSSNVFLGINQIVSASNKIVWYDNSFKAGYLEWGGITSNASQGTLASAAGLIKQAISSNSSTSASTALATTDIFGGTVEHILKMTGAITAASNIQLPTASALQFALQSILTGTAWRLRIINSGGSGAGIWTVTTNTGWTLTGTMTVAVGGYRDFILTFTSVPATVTCTLVSIGSGVV